LVVQNFFHPPYHFIDYPSNFELVAPFVNDFRYQPQHLCNCSNAPLNIVCNYLIIHNNSLTWK
jgi:hypothetical protein